MVSEIRPKLLLLIFLLTSSQGYAQVKTGGDQYLLNGRIWHNKFQKVSGNQFFITNAFLKGSVTLNGRKYNDLDLLYDIADDELILKPESYPVIIMNKEFVDSFTLRNGERTYKIINERTDTFVIHRGYINVLYEGSTAFYVKYRKRIQPLAVDGISDLFFQETRMYIRQDTAMVRVERKRDILNLLKDKKKEVKDFIRIQRINGFRLSAKNPDTVIPVLKYYDSLKN